MRSKAILKDYFKALTDVASQGDAREESFYSCLETLFHQFATSTGRSEVHVTTLPKKTEAGNPDFRLWDGQCTSTKPSTLSPSPWSCGTTRSAAIRCWQSGSPPGPGAQPGRDQNLLSRGDSHSTNHCLAGRDRRPVSKSRGTDRQNRGRQVGWVEGKRR